MYFPADSFSVSTYIAGTFDYRYPVVFSDEKNHASMIAGLRNSGVEKRIFKHNSIDSLRKLLSGVENARPKIIDVESIN